MLDGKGLLFSTVIFISFCASQGQETCPVIGPRGNTTECGCIPNLITFSNGAPIDNNVATMVAGRSGPVVLTDTNLIEQLAHLNRERIPERVVHARGAGAGGYFIVTNTSITQYCKASLFQELGKVTEIFLRFSISQTNLGSCDLIVSTRGAAVKFYTDDGIFDIPGLNVPIFALREPILLPSLIHTARRDPVTHLANNTLFWDFVCLRPETIHQVMIGFSDRGIPDGYRHMNFFGINVYKMVNAQRVPYYVKFNFKTHQGVKSLSVTEAFTICGVDPDYAVRDLYNNIAAGNYPAWTMYYQVMTFEQAETYKWDPFDNTKVWPKKEFPYHEIGTVVLNRNPRNTFAEVEQVAFSVANLVPGIEPSPDRVLQTRMFAYADAQRYRLGANFKQLPVNMPRVPVNNNQRDGAATYYNQDGNIVYFPNSFGQNICPFATPSEYPVCGDVARYDTKDEDNFSQPQVLWGKVFNDTQRQILTQNIAASAVGLPESLQRRIVDLMHCVGEDLAAGVLKILGI